MPTTPSTENQCAGTVLMVRPATFYAHPETVASNSFQHVADGPGAATLAAAQSEFDGVAKALATVGVQVAAIEADSASDTPDALFPNNWFSTHADGQVVLYPMAVPSRRRERRPELITNLAASYGLRITHSTDLTHLEERNLIVEGTGSLVLDRSARIAYACLSPRTHEAAVRIACKAVGYEALVFSAHGSDGRSIYHTNVMMSVGPAVAVICGDLIRDGTARRRVLDSLERTHHAILEISAGQVEAFAGNILFLDGGATGTVVAISRRAWQSLAVTQRRQLERYAQPAICVVDTIEGTGGGGIRCMLAEVFLPLQSHASDFRLSTRGGAAT